MLSLSDPKWREFSANFTDGRHVADLLARAESGEPADHWYDELFQELCHQYTVSEAAYYAAPHLAQISADHPDQRKDLLVLLGSCHASSMLSDLESLPTDAVKEWQSSAIDTLPLIAALLAEPQQSKDDLRYLLSSAAALHGYPDLASAIERLDEYL